MKDIHNHLLANVDDGVSTLEESINTLNKLKEIGFSDIILTPHYVMDSRYNLDNPNKLNKFNELKKQNINTNIYLGNEIYINDSINDLINNNSILPLNNTKYLLIELSLFNQLSNDTSILFDLTKYGYTIILAHPERYQYYQNNIDFFKSLVDKGILLQGNLTSLLNKKDKKMLIKLLDSNLIHFLATDIHREEDIDLIKRSLLILKRLIPSNKVNELLNINPSKVINNEPIKECIVVKYSLLDLLKRRFI